jgi:hypothetical protein
MNFLHIPLLFLLFIIPQFAYSQSNELEYKDLIRPVFDTEDNFEYASLAKDITTPKGWDIKYFVKNDSTKDRDIYISCEKNGVKTLYFYPKVLTFRTYFLPTFSQETEEYIYFEYGCATDCGAVLAFSKKNYSFSSFGRIIETNLKLDLLVLMTDNAYKKETELFEFEVVDLARNNNYLVSFDMICRGVYKQNCIKEVVFSKNEIIIKLVLSDKEWTKETEQIRVIKL